MLPRNHPLLAVVTPPRIEPFCEVTGVDPDDEMTGDFVGWSKLALLTRDRAFLLPYWAARDLEGGFSAAPRVPEGEDFDAASLGIDLVVEVVATPAEKKAANALLLGVASSRSNSRLSRYEFEGSLEFVGEGKRGCRPIGSPPR